MKNPVNNTNPNFYIIKNARIVDCEQRSTPLCDILLRRARGDEDSEIIEIGLNIKPSDTESGRISSYNAHSRLVCHSFFDLHCRFGAPGFEYREDTVTGSLAAVSGGYGYILLSPDQADGEPSELKRKIEYQKKWAACRIFNTAPITTEHKGEYLCNFEQLVNAGAAAFSDMGGPYLSSGIMRYAMKKCAQLDALVIAGVSDGSLSFDGCVNEGRISKLLGVGGIPSSAEDTAVARNIILASETGCRLHIPAVSTKGAVSMIRQAKKLGINVTCGTCPQYFALTEDDVLFMGANAKVDPPLRTSQDRQAIVEALCDGTIDCISSGHTPLSKTEKGKTLNEAKFGAVGLETAFAAGLTYLVLPEYMDIYRLISLMTTGPASIIGENGKIMAGKRADMVLFNTESEMVYTQNIMKSRSFNTPFYGISLRGGIEDRFINGR